MGIIGVTSSKIGSKIDSFNVDSQTASQKVDNNVTTELDLDFGNVEKVDFNTTTGTDIDYESVFSDPEANQDKLGTMNEEEYNSYIEYVKNTYKDAMENLTNNTNALQDGLNKINGFLAEGKGTIKVIREQEEAFNNGISIDLLLAKKGFQTDKIIEKYGLTEEDINEKKIDELISIVKNREMYQEQINKLNKRADDTLERIIEENPEYSEYKDLSYSDIIQLKTMYQNYIKVLESTKAGYQNSIDTAKYDNLKYLKDYDTFEQEYIITPSDLQKYTTETTNNFGLEYKTFDYESYLKEHPNTTPTDFVRAVKEIENSDAENGLMGKIYQIKGLEDKEAIEDLLEIKEYQENVKNGQEYLIPLTGLDTDYAKIYEYLYREDPNKAKEFLNDISSVLKQYEGACMATSEIEELVSLNNEEKGKAILDFLNIALDGTGDGIYDIGEGFVKLFADGELSAQDYKVMMYMSYLEQNDESILGLENVYQTGQAVGTMLPVVTAGVIFAGIAPELAAATIAGTSTTIGQAASLGAMGTSIFGTTQNQLKYEGYTDLQAYSYALLAAGSEALFEKYGGLIGLADVPEATFIKRMLREGGQEAVQEIFQQTFGDALILGKEINLDELSEDVLKSFVMGAIVAGTLNGYTNGISAVISGKSVTITPDILKKLAIEMEEHPENSTIDLLKRMIPELNPRDNSVLIKELNEGNIKISNLTVIEIDQLLKDENLSKEFISVLKTISDENVNELEKNILDHISPNMSQLEMIRLIYYELGKRVNYDEAYRAAKAKKDTIKMAEIYNEEMTYEKLNPKNLQDNNIICAHWAQLMAKTLIDAGIPPKSIVIQRVKKSSESIGYNLDSHVAIYIILDDGGIICPDLTAPIGKRTDLYNVKMGNETEGFLYFTEDQVKQFSGLEDDNIDIQELIEGIRKYDEVFEGRYYIENKNLDQKEGLTEYQMKFFENVGKFVNASEIGDTEGLSKSKIKSLKSAQRKRIEVQKDLVKYLEKMNKDEIKKFDSKIEEYKKQDIDFIDDNVKILFEKEEYLEYYKTLDIDMIKSGEIEQAFLQVDELETTKIIPLKEFMGAMAESERIPVVKENNIPSTGPALILKQVATRDGETLYLPFETYYDGQQTGKFEISNIDGKLTISENKLE